MKIHFTTVLAAVVALFISHISVASTQQEYVEGMVIPITVGLVEVDQCYVIAPEGIRGMHLFIDANNVPAAKKLYSKRVSGFWAVSIRNASAEYAGSKTSGGAVSGLMWGNITVAGRTVSIPKSQKVLMAVVKRSFSPMGGHTCFISTELANNTQAWEAADAATHRKVFSKGNLTAYRYWLKRAKALQTADAIPDL